MTLILTHSAFKVLGAKNCLEIYNKRVTNPNDGVFFFIAHENGFTFYAQPQTGAYSFLISVPKNDFAENEGIQAMAIVTPTPTLNDR